MRVVSPIDPFEGQRYIDLVYSEGKGDYLDHIYNVTAIQEDYTNITIDGNLSWRCVSSCTFDSREALEGWKNRLHKVSMRRCARVTRSVWRVENESGELPTYEGFIYTLEMTLRTWYTSMELWQESQDLEIIANQFAHTLEFPDGHPTIDAVLQAVKERIVVENPIKEANSHHYSATI